MKRTNVPSCGARYWVALSLASILGCNTGDAFASAFGFVGGLPILVAAFALVVFMERRDARPRQAYYWFAILVVRTAATNLADFTIHGIGMAPALGALTVVLALALAGVAASSRSKRPVGRRIELPPVDGWYWAVMLVAGTLGTAIGDFASFRSGLGLPLASLALSGLVAAILAIGSARLLAFTAYYWFAIVCVRAAGTSVGDFFAKNAGLATSTVAMSVVFVAFLAFVKDREAVLLPPLARTP